MILKKLLHIFTPQTKPIKNKKSYKKLKWYKCLGIKKHKEMVATKKKLYEEYNKKENLICNQYIENIEYLKMFLESFFFVATISLCFLIPKHLYHFKLSTLSRISLL